MSKTEGAPVGLTIMEKLIGLIMIAIGAITFYVTYTNLSIETYSTLFLAAGLVMVALGVLLFIAKTE